LFYRFYTCNMGGIIWVGSQPCAFIYRPPILFLRKFRNWNFLRCYSNQGKINYYKIPSISNSIELHFTIYSQKSFLLYRISFSIIQIRFSINLMLAVKNIYIDLYVYVPRDTQTVHADIVLSSRFIYIYFMFVFKFMITDAKWCMMQNFLCHVYDLRH